MQSLEEPTIFNFQQKDIGRIFLFKKEGQTVLDPWMLILNQSVKEYDDPAILILQNCYTGLKSTIGNLVGVLEYNLVKIVDEYITLPINTIISRKGDMGAETIELLIEDDGDISIALSNGATDFKEFERVSMQFCSPGMGGGKSPRTLKALRNLFIAIQEDNKEYPNVR